MMQSKKKHMKKKKSTAARTIPVLLLCFLLLSGALIFVNRNGETAPPEEEKNSGGEAEAEGGTTEEKEPETPPPPTTEDLLKEYIADLTVDGTLCTGGAVCVIAIISGFPIWLAILLALIAGMLSGLATGIFHTLMGIPPILAGILTQFALWSVNLRILGGANQAISADKYDLLTSLRYLTNTDLPFYKNPLFMIPVFLIVEA